MSRQYRVGAIMVPFIECGSHCGRSAPTTEVDVGVCQMQKYTEVIELPPAQPAARRLRPRQHFVHGYQTQGSCTGRAALTSEHDVADLDEPDALEADQQGPSDREQYIVLVPHFRQHHHRAGRNGDH